MVAVRRTLYNGVAASILLACLGCNDTPSEPPPGAVPETAPPTIELEPAPETAAPTEPSGASTNLPDGAGTPGGEQGDR